MLHEFFFKKPSGADMQQRKSSEAYLCQILLVKYKPQWHRYACTQNPGCISAPVKLPGADAIYDSLKVRFADQGGSNNNPPNP